MTDKFSHFGKGKLPRIHIMNMKNYGVWETILSYLGKGEYRSNKDTTKRK